MQNKILIEKYLEENSKQTLKKIEVYCFPEPKLIIKKHGEDTGISIYDNKLNPIKSLFKDDDTKIIKESADELIKTAINLSAKLSSNFNFVRIDWVIYKSKIYFEEMTFTPNSGFISFNKKINKKLGKYIKIERKKHGF